MSCFTKNIIRDGTSQRQRMALALNPESFKLIGDTTEDLIHFTAKFAKQIAFYNDKNQIDGDWSIFFEKKELLEIAGQLETKNNLKPHHALFFSFLKLYQILQHDLNGLNKRFLDYYYKDVLRFTPKQPEADKVHVIFELARQVDSLLLKEGTKLKAGKDENGNEQIYALERDIVLSQAKVARISSIFRDRSNNNRAYIAPYANSRNGLGQKIKDKNIGWLPFGESQKNRPLDNQTMIEGELGFAIASPIFVFEEGFKQITITIGFAESLFNGNIPKKAFNTYLSGEKEWIRLKSEASFTKGAIFEHVNPDDNDSPLIEQPVKRDLEITLTSDEALKITRFNSQALEQNFDSVTPVLKLLLDPLNSFAYQRLIDYKINSIKIEVTVNNLKKLSISTDQGVIDASKPFQPFGARPKIGSAFEVRADELKGKKITKGEVTINWADRPSEIASTYYNSYVKRDDSTFITGEDLKLKFRVNDNDPFLDGNSDLFPLDLDDPITRIELKQTDFSEYIIGTSISQKFKTFGHEEFPIRYAEIAIGKAANSAGFLNVNFPNLPYTPLVKTINLCYTAEEEITFDQSGNSRFYHIEPFGVRPITSRFSSLTPLIDQEGYLFIGLKDFKPPQQISLLFQLLEGSGQLTDDEGNLISPLKSEDLNWHYLGKDEWIKLSSSEIIAENTKGLQNSGIIELSIGEDASDSNSRMPLGVHWLRVSVGEKTQTGNRIIEILPQAALVKYQKSEVNLKNNVIDKARILTQGSITKLYKANKAIKKIHQPYSSFGGRGTENEHSFYTRVSERLRHKKRAITLWDYERLVLEQFPSIYKVKCLNHTNADSNTAPGEVSIVLVSNLRNQNTGNFLQPYVSIKKLHEVEYYIQQLTPSFVKIHTTNPNYEEVLLDFKVSFKAGYDAGFYADRLNETIKELLSPWAFEKGQDIIFGGRVYKAELLAFIEEQEYVDFITDFELYHNRRGKLNCPGIGEMRIRPTEALEEEDDFVIRQVRGITIGDIGMEIGNTFIVGEPVEVVAPINPKAIIVSADKHRIRILRPTYDECQGEALFGIGLMRVGIDFEVVEN